MALRTQIRTGNENGAVNRKLLEDRIRDVALDLADLTALSTAKVLFSTGVAVTHTGDTNEFTFATFVIPANSMGINGILRISPIWEFTGSTNAKTLRTKFGGTALTVASVSTLSAIVLGVPSLIWNKGVTNSQGGAFQTTAGSAATSFASVSGAIDTTADVTLLLTGQLANSGETLTLDTVLVELLRS